MAIHGGRGPLKVQCSSGTPTRYAVFVDDNFHYMDEDERHKAGEFDDYESAVALCRTIVDRFLLGHYEQGMTPDDLYKAYTSFGEDPFVRPRPSEPSESFSAWTYARQRCEEICR